MILGGIWSVFFFFFLIFLPHHAVCKILVPHRNQSHASYFGSVGSFFSHYFFLFELKDNCFTILWSFFFFAIYQHELATGIHVSPHPESPSHLHPHPILLDCPRALTSGALLHALNLHWSSVLHMLMYMFQCYSLKSSHLCLLPLSPKVCSLHLCRLCCPACRIISPVFLNSIYMH